MFLFRIMRARLLSLFIFLNFFCYSQEPAKLLNKLKAAQTDTQKINTLNTLTQVYLERNNLDSASIFNKKSLELASVNVNEKYSFKSIYLKASLARKNKNFEDALLTINEALEIAKKYNSKADQAKALWLTGNIHDQNNRNDLALENFIKSLSLAKSANDKKQIMSAYLSLGIYYKKLTKTTESLKNLLEAMKLAESIPDTSTMFKTCINLGSMYERTNDKNKALEFYRKALILNQQDHDIADQAIVYYKLGKFFHGIKQLDSARYYLIETRKIHEKLNDKVGMIFDYANLAGFNLEDKDYESAEKNYYKALDLGLKDNDSNKINLLYSYLGGMYKDLKKYEKALKYYHASISYINSTVPKETITMEYKKMSEIYYDLGKYKEAFDNYIQYKAWSDSSFNVNETKKQTELKLNYEFDKTQKKIEAETKAKELISQAELETEHKQRNFLLIGLAVISLMLIITVKNYNAKQKANHILYKQKQEIEHQKKIVEQKNIEINDSIMYAQRIQGATTPTILELNSFFKNYDLFFKPKDVVSGDFYWAASNEIKDGNGQIHKLSLVAVADCTGHGVPGAITSMIGSMLLNEIFYVKQIYQPDKVLMELNRLVKLTLRQESDTQSNDGMDIGFCLINYSTNELLYAGANRPLYIINDQNGLTEYKPTKMSIGGQVPLIQNYELNKIQLNPGDTIVISTDGYADQFGGNETRLKTEFGQGKKFTTRAFRNLLLSNYKLSPKEQKLAIENAFNNWKGEHEQTDDILVFILKV